MNRFRRIGLTSLAAALIVLQATQLSIYAASNGGPSGNPSAQQPGSTATGSPGTDSYTAHCATCHGENREGNPPTVPSLLGVKQRLTDQQITTLVHNGKGQMPAFPEVQQAELTALLRYLGTPAIATPKPEPAATASVPGSHVSGPSAAGGAIFAKDCGFCHGRDAMGGESGPDLTSSRLVRTDRGGDKISDVVLNGRIDKGMPAFKFSSEELLQIAAFIHAQEAAAAVVKKGGRRGVEVADLQTGNAEAGKQYFDGAGGCVKCHSATGDLAGIANRYEGLQLEERMLYPRGAKSQVTVKLPSGDKIAGVLAYQDEFTIGLRDSSGIYHSWETSQVKYVVDSPVDAHVELFSKYTDADIHNLMAYLQTMR